MTKKVELPVDRHKAQILETVEENPVTIIIAETSAGKSTRIPFMLMEHFQTQIVITEPRRIAASSLATWVAEENDLVLGNTIGFRTSTERNDSNESTCLYVTDGLHLVRELMESRYSIKNGVILVIDEIHEFNENIEVLLAWSKNLLNEGYNVKIVVMSATMEHELLSRYFDNAPIIYIEGKVFPVVGSPTETTPPHQISEVKMARMVQESVSAGNDTLVFLPGRAEISNFRRELETLGLMAEIIELHGELSLHEQKLAFESYEIPKVILATNIAQTSLTIPGITCVVDSGYEKRIELWNGVETLVRRSISKADVRQRAGRAGRTGPGTYVLCHDVPYGEFTEYPIPEIQQKRLDQMVLRLATAGFDATQLHFFHQPDISVLKDSRQMLIDMEAMIADGTVTELGHQINRFPTSVAVARMIIEAINRKCLSRILTIAAILSNAKMSIKLKRNPYRTDPPHFKMWDEIIDTSKEYKSDLIVELELWDIAFKNYELWGQLGIDRKNYLESVEIRKKLKTIVFDIGYNAGPEYNVHATDDIELLKCITAGMIHNVYLNIAEGRYLGSEPRNLYKDTLVYNGGYPKLIVGVPINIPKKGNMTGNTSGMVPVISNCTAIELEWLEEIAPNLLKMTKEVNWNDRRKLLTVDEFTLFNGKEVECTSTEAEWSVKNLEIFAQKIVGAPRLKNSDETQWIYAMLEDFVLKGRLISEFIPVFIQAITEYETLRVTELKNYKREIRKKVLLQPKEEKTILDVQDNDFLSTLYRFCQKNKATLEFTIEEKMIQKRKFFSAKCTVSFDAKTYEAHKDKSYTTKVLAKNQTAKVMCKKIGLL